MRNTMVASTSYNQFRIDVRPSPATNDHEVRFLGDGEDIIARFWNKMMGLDPDDILVTPCPLVAVPTAHKATIARCGCGVVECDRIDVDIARSEDVVEWTWSSPEPATARFLASSYDGEV